MRQKTIWAREFWLNVSLKNNGVLGLETDAQAPSTGGATKAVFDSWWSTAAEDGLFSDLEPSAQEEACGGSSEKDLRPTKDDRTARRLYLILSQFQVQYMGNNKPRTQRLGDISLDVRSNVLLPIEMRKQKSYNPS
ncbi:hypothetical protein U1Q18_026829 [Sarracenia purpurea var. burkii]